MAYELQKLTPTYMLHAGRYSALGMDVTSRAARLAAGGGGRGRLWRDVAARHLPQPARLPVARVGAAVLRLRRARVPRLLEFARLVHDAERPARPALPRPRGRRPRRCARRSCARSTATPDVRAMNTRHQARYRRWAYRLRAAPVYGVEIYKDTMIYYSDPETGEPRGSRRAAGAAARERPRRRRATIERLAAGDLHERHDRGARTKRRRATG